MTGHANSTASSSVFVTIHPPAPSTPFVKGMPGVTDLIVSGIVRIHNISRQPRHIEHLEVNLLGVLSTAVVDDRQAPAMEYRRVQRHMDVSIPVAIRCPILPARSVVEHRFAMAVPVGIKLFPTFNIQLAGAKPVSAQQQITSSTLVSTKLPHGQEDQLAHLLDPAKNKIARLTTSNGYHLTAHLTLAAAGATAPPVVASSHPTRVLSGMFPIEPEIVQASCAPPTPTSTPVHLPRSIRTSRDVPITLTLPPHVLAAASTSDPRIRVRVDLHQKVAFDMASVRGAAASTVASTVVLVRAIPTPQPIRVRLPPLPPTTFANAYLNVAYDASVTAYVHPARSPIAALLRRLVGHRKPATPASTSDDEDAAPASAKPAPATSPSLPKLKLHLPHALPDDDSGVRSFPLATHVSVVVAPVSKETAERALVDGPWLLLPHDHAFGDVPASPGGWEPPMRLVEGRVVPVERRRRGRRSAEGERRFVDEEREYGSGTPEMEDEEEEEEEGEEEEGGVTERLVRIPTACYRPMRGLDEDLPRYEPPVSGEVQAF
ncbi:hypothetical protein HDU96_009859 [Phlyctochytrium bullatum]|nr:hypothetical protein HDU96_009859 [Phlyctochytrium bullatum]